MGAVNEYVTKQNLILVLEENLSAAGATDYTQIIDLRLQDCSDGIYFGFVISYFSSGGPFTLKFKHSNSYNGPFDWVGLDNLVLGRHEATVGDAWPVLSAANNPLTWSGTYPDQEILYDGNIIREGLVGTKRYIQVIVTTSATTTADFQVFAVCNPLIMPRGADGQVSPASSS